MAILTDLFQACRGRETLVKPGPRVQRRLVHIHASPGVPAAEVSGRSVILLLLLLLLTAAREVQENAAQGEHAEGYRDAELPGSVQWQEARVVVR